MFEAHREKKAYEHYEAELARWQQTRDSTAYLVDLAQNYHGDVTSDLILKPGEAVFATVTDAALIEERSGPGHYAGRSSGLSMPIANLGGHEIRYHVAATRGHYVQGAPIATGVDTGTIYVTNQRITFQGGRQTRECLFAKLIGVRYAPDGSVTISVSNRSKPTVLHYGTELAGWFEFRATLALAHFRSTVPDLVAQLHQQLAHIDQAKPAAVAPPG